MARTLGTVFRRLLCQHRQRSTKRSPAGVTLTWHGSLVVLFEWIETCGRCGRTWKFQGLLPFWHSAHSTYQPDGPRQWPIDPETGEKLPRAS